MQKCFAAFLQHFCTCFRVKHAEERDRREGREGMEREGRGPRERSCGGAARSLNTALCECALNFHSLFDSVHNGSSNNNALSIAMVLGLRLKAKILSVGTATDNFQSVPCLMTLQSPAVFFLQSSPCFLSLMNVCVVVCGGPWQALL